MAAGSPPKTRSESRVVRVVRRLLLAVGWAFALGGAALMLLNAFPELQLTNEPTALAASFIPYGIPAWAAATLFFALAARRRMKLLAVLTVACLIVQIAWARTYWPRTAPVSSDDSLIVVSMNLRCDETALIELVPVLAREQPDIVVFQDFSQEAWDHLQGTSWSQMLPHHWIEPKDQPLAAGLDPCGTMVFASTPVTLAGSAEDPQPVFDVELASGTLTVVPVSLPTVSEGVDRWLQGFETLDEAITIHATTVSDEVLEPMLVIGDFNATREHLPMRQLIAEHGLVDAAEQAGAGWLPTFPANRRHPPLVAIDHILMSPGLSASEVTAFSVRYGAHRVLVAHINPT